MPTAILERTGMPTTTYLSTHALARRWEISVGTLANWRVRAEGPPYIKVGAMVRYALADVEAFEAAGRVETN